MKQTTFFYKLTLTICLLAAAILTILAGCEKTPTANMKDSEAPQGATATTAAHGVMHPGARRHKKVPTP